MTRQNLGKPPTPGERGRGDSPHSVLTDAAGTVSVEDAVRIVRERYGVDARVSRLSGERDDNFRVRTENVDWMLKIAHSREETAVTEFQSAVLDHLAGTASAVPRLVRTRAGAAHEWIADGPAAGRAIRMTTFIAGTLLRDTPIDPALAARLGRTAAELDCALADFTHPGAAVELLWDVQQAHRTRELVAGHPELPGGDVLRDGLDRFVREVAPRLRQLPKQVIHNDFNPDNILVGTGSEPVIGVVDFGDAVVAPRVIDLAVAASYHVGATGSPGSGELGAALDVIAGYHAHTPLTGVETGLLYELIVARVLTAITIASWRAARFPDNDDYILRNTAGAWRRLRLLLAADPAAVTDQIERKCARQ